MSVPVSHTFSVLTECGLFGLLVICGLPLCGFSLIMFSQGPSIVSTAPAPPLDNMVTVSGPTITGLSTAREGGSGKRSLRWLVSCTLSSKCFHKGIQDRCALCTHKGQPTPALLLEGCSGGPPLKLTSPSPQSHAHPDHPPRPCLPPHSEAYRTLVTAWTHPFPNYIFSNH